MSWSFRELLEDGSFDWRSVPMERIDPFLVSTLRFVDVLRRGYNARTRCQSIWKSVIAFHFMNSNVMRGNEFNARDTYQQGVDLSSCFMLPFYGVPCIRCPFPLYDSLNYASFSSDYTLDWILLVIKRNVFKSLSLSIDRSVVDNRSEIVVVFKTQG